MVNSPFQEPIGQFGEQDFLPRFGALAGGFNEGVVIGRVDVRAGFSADGRHVRLEIASSFSFQSRWLGDLAPHLLTEEDRARLVDAKRIASARAKLEARIPKRLEYKKGWPEFVPTPEDCRIVADVRVEVGQLMGIPVQYTTPEAVRQRYQELFEEKLRKEAKKAKKQQELSL